MAKLDLYRVVQEARSLPPLPKFYTWTLFECFCDGYLAHQQSVDGIHYQAMVPPSYRPQQVLLAFDGDPVLALDGNRVLLNRLSQPLHMYQGGRKPLAASSRPPLFPRPAGEEGPC